MDTNEEEQVIDQASEAMKMRIRIAKLHHSQYLQAILNDFGAIGQDSFGIKMWNDVCDARFKELGHTHTDFMKCTCVENKSVTG